MAKRMPGLGALGHVRLGTRIAAFSVAAGLALLGGAWMASDWVLETAARHHDQVLMHGWRDVWMQFEHGLHRQLEASTRTLTRDREVMQALAAGDDAALEEVAATTARRLAGMGVAGVVRIAGVDGRIRFAEPPQSGGAPLAAAAAKDGRMVEGLVAGADGGVDVAVAFPLYWRGRMVGAATVAQPLAAVLPMFRKSLSEEEGVQLFLLSPAGQPVWASDPDLFSRLPAVDATRSEPAAGRGAAAGKTWNLVTLPLKDRSGTVLGQLLIAADTTAAARAERSAEQRAGIALLVMVVAFAVLSAWVVRRSLAPLAHTDTLAAKVAEGDLTVRIGLEGRSDEIGRVGAAFDRMVEKLREILGRVREAGESLGGEAEQLSGISEALHAHGTEVQGHTDQVAAAVNEMAASIQDIARNAQHAAEAAREADEKAVHGQEVMHEVVGGIERLSSEATNASQAVERLREETNGIGMVLDVIREIAEQTNLLALNAAIEAARAGEMGRGFAVVADEVRQLATRTQESTQEVQAKIERLKEEVERVVASMGRSYEQTQDMEHHIGTAVDALTEIRNTVQTMTDMNGQIAAAVEQQSAVADDISRNVTDITEAVRETMGKVGEVAEVSRRLVGESTKMKGVLESFRL